MLDEADPMRIDRANPRLNREIRETHSDTQEYDTQRLDSWVNLIEDYLDYGHIEEAVTFGKVVVKNCLKFSSTLSHKHPVRTKEPIPCVQHVRQSIRGNMDDGKPGKIFRSP